MKRERLLKLAGIILEQQPKDYVVNQHQGSTKDQIMELIPLPIRQGYVMLLTIFNCFSRINLRKFK